MTWSQPEVSGEQPCERAAHSGCSFGRNLYIFGGMNTSGALDDLFSLDTGTKEHHYIKQHKNTVSVVNVQY